MTRNGSDYFHAFLDCLRVKSKVRMISEISAFSYLALGKFENSGISERFFSGSGMNLRFISNCDLQL